MYLHPDYFILCAHLTKEWPKQTYHFFPQCIWPFIGLRFGLLKLKKTRKCGPEFLDKISASNPSSPKHGINFFLRSWVWGCTPPPHPPTPLPFPLPSKKLFTLSKMQGLDTCNPAQHRCNGKPENSCACCSLVWHAARKKVFYRGRRVLIARQGSCWPR